MSESIEENNIINSKRKIRKRMKALSNKALLTIHSFQLPLNINIENLRMHLSLFLSSYDFVISFVAKFLLDSTSNLGSLPSHICNHLFVGSSLIHLLTTCKLTLADLHGVYYTKFQQIQGRLPKHFFLDHNDDDHVRGFCLRSNILPFIVASLTF